ncbi:Aste57867_420 [Aphanomyces stellatus]|uniref:Aste57867_420 protein n=1 Tax=Aphanomyces stellatus TaxID=120398 RepID=A0A485K2Y5_9STRA|nr:hypothetical protein As57867_000419 [Aphanomyces stellatus]VFT77645.1 Aste57867_420 [Aphanomyces stellatus]
MKLFTVLALVASAALASLTQLPDGRIRTPDELLAIQDDADTNRKCHQANGNYIPSLKPGQYTASKFHNCFRTDAQIYEYLDAIAAQSPSLVSKFQLTTTFKGLPVYGYKITKDGGATKKALYFQAMQHAREWVAGSSTLYALSSFLDDLASGNPTPFDNYNLYFVPVVNRDGYQKTWSGKRYQRKNANEVDLNRNWPNTNPNPRPESPGSETYPGPYKLSEKESQGIDAWLSSKSDEIDGAIDVHTYAGLILYAYGDTDEPSPHEAQFDTLGQAMKAVMGKYVQEPAWKLYFAYGVFPDYYYRKFTKPAITIEMVGNDFVAPASTIRARGDELKKGFVEFANQVPLFLGGANPTTEPPSDEPTDEPIDDHP